jgi:hypothetical protein
MDWTRILYKSQAHWLWGLGVRIVANEKFTTAFLFLFILLGIDFVNVIECVDNVRIRLQIW